MRPISKRAERLPASAIRKLMPHAVAAKARGVTVHHLNIGQPDVHAPDSVPRAMKGYDQALIAYTASQGDASYVDTLIAYYRRWGVTLDPDQINVTTGGSEALLFALLGALDPGDEILLPEPFYANYASFAAITATTIRPITTDVKSGFHLPDKAALAAHVGPRTRAFLLCNPSNPTGTVYTRAEIEAVAELCREHDLWLIADEVYREFVFADEPDTYRTVLALPDMSQRVIMVDSVSKRFSMCGARVGCLVSRHPGLMNAVLRMSTARLSPPGLGQWAATHAHHAPQAYFDEARDEYRSRRDLVYDALNAIPGVTAARPEGAFYTVARLPVDDADHFARWLLTDFESQGETLMVAPAGGFYATPGLGRDEVRIAYVLDKVRLKRAMELLHQALVVYRDR